MTLHPPTDYLPTPESRLVHSPFNDPKPVILCVNDFRHWQNQKNPPPLTALANIVIHDNIHKLKGNLDPADFIFNLLVPKHLKVVILLEFISCEKHNFTGDPASIKHYVLCEIEPRLTHVFNNLFGGPPKYNISHRFVSKSILILLFLEHLVDIFGESFLLNKFADGNASYKILLKTLVRQTCTFPIVQCPEIPLFRNFNNIQCKIHPYYLKSYGFAVKPHNYLFLHSEWVQKF